MIGLFDPMYFVFMVPPLVLSWWASRRVKTTFARYSRVPTAGGLTGAQAARRLLDAKGLKHVAVERVGGMLTDHYHPVKKQLALSNEVYASSSVAAIGVAMHEAGHALQHQAGYFPMWVRSALVPAVSFGSKSWMWVLMAGALIPQFRPLVLVGIGLFAVTVLFQLVTLPVEFDASARAKRLMVEHRLVSSQEAEGAAKVLSAAALTYVAGALSSLMMLLYYLYRFGLLRGRR